MHEVGLSEGVLDAALRRAAGRQLTGLRVRVGALHRVHDDAMTQGFQMVSAGTAAEGAVMTLVHLPARVRCRACGTEAEGEELIALCPSCGRASVDVIGGEELVLESISLAGGDDVADGTVTQNGGGHVPGHPG
jgi:hydrogenase nickel incorporation protein HypA/HybF